VKKKFTIIAVIVAIVASVLGFSALKVEAAGSPEQATCFLDKPTLATQWQISNNYFEGIEVSQDALNVSQKFRFEGFRAMGPKRLVMAFSTKNYAKLTAMACYEVFIVDHMVDVDGQPMYYADGSPVTYQRVISADWKDANPHRMVVWSGSEQSGALGTRGTNLVAWVVGGNR